jgi:hypothetical protein
MDQDMVEIRRHLQGKMVGWNPGNRHLRIRFHKWWVPSDDQSGIVTFRLDPYAVIASADGMCVSPMSLEAGQEVHVSYVRQPCHYPLVKTLTVEEET